MQIEKIHINNFGKLNNKEIEVKKGINIIYGKNESGKSTLLKFITSIFYGANKNKNGKKISDYDRYKPWVGEDYSGKIKYMLDNNEEYEVYRNFSKKNPQIFDNDGNDISKNYEIDKTTGNRFFAKQTGIDEELFNTSVVVEQQDIKLNEKKQNTLIQKASNIILTGEDDVSYNKILAKLNKKQLEEIGTDKSPTKPMYIMKKKISELKEKKEELEKILPLKYEIEDYKKELNLKIKLAEKELEVMQDIQKTQNEVKIEEEKININIKSKEEIQKNINEKKEEIKNISTAKQTKKISNILYIIPILLTIIGVMLLMFKKIQFAIFSIIVGVISFSIISSLKINENKKYKKTKDIEKRNKREIESKIDILEKELESKETDIRQKQDELRNKINLQNEQIKNKYCNLENLNNILNEKIENDNLIQEQRYINNLKVELKSKELEQNEITKRIENLVNIEEEIVSLEDNLKEIEFTNEAINIAKETLGKAYEEMKENVTPKFAENVSNAINNISNGKYKRVKVNEIDGLIVEAEDGKYISGELLSIGTIDQLYLSLRISSINELTKEKMPIILDEAFAYFDKERLENVIQFLNNNYQDRQILILTCTNREIQCLESNNISYNKICL